MCRAATHISSGLAKQKIGEKRKLLLTRRRVQSPRRVTKRKALKLLCFGAFLFLYPNILLVLFLVLGQQLGQQLLLIHEKERLLWQAFIPIERTAKLSRSSSNGMVDETKTADKLSDVPLGNPIR